ncbi:unnamed protein product, partial [Brassica oleracea var. botrytis]
IVVKNNDGERNECVSACLNKEELKKMNSPSILYSVKGMYNIYS